MTRLAAACAALLMGLGVCMSATAEQSAYLIDLAGLLERAGARVTEYFARAQSIMCLEKVSLQKLNFGYGSDGPARFVESELRLSWEPSPEDPTPKEARTLRQVLRVNGHAPRKKDWDNCTTPEQQASEVQPLSILLPDSRVELTFTYGGRAVVDGRDAVVITFREKIKPTVDVSLVEDNENCISFDIDGGMQGKIWLDAETNEHLEFTAKVIFLCASTFGSAFVMLNSVSKRFPNGLGNDSGELGHNLMDHHNGGGATASFSARVAA